MFIENFKLALLVNMHDPHAVFDEICSIANTIYADAETSVIRDIFNDIIDLFNGTYPGYRECNTEYHNLKHTTDAMLALARLIHGASVTGADISRRAFFLGIISAMFHDVGYIQTADDLQGTGAKYTINHVPRGIAFMQHYFKEKGFPQEDFNFCRNVILCTEISTDITALSFESDENLLTGCMMGTADLLGQMADRSYLEKLLFLYYEFLDANIPGLTTEIDLLKNTLVFYNSIQVRLQTKLNHVCRFMIHHFANKYGIERDIYQEGIDRNIEYLNYILKNHEKEYRVFLRRDGIVEQLSQKMR